MGFILVRIHGDRNGQSHFDEIGLEWFEREFCPPSPTGYAVTDVIPGQNFAPAHRLRR